VPPEAKAAIAASVQASNSPSAQAGDKTGGFHEEGGIWGTDAAGKAVAVPAVPGKAADPRAEKNASIDVYSSANPALKQSLASVGGEWHVHPSGSMLGLDGNTRFFDQGPSKDTDIPRAAGPMNIVVGAGEKKVYFYDKSGVIGTMKLKDFLRH